MQRIAVSWLVYRLTGSAFLLGFVGFAVTQNKFQDAIKAYEYAANPKPTSVKVMIQL